MISRTFASVFPRQSLSSLILASSTAEADSTGTVSFISRSTLALNVAAFSVTGNRLLAEMRKFSIDPVSHWI
jgi:hypothetical protein